MLVSKRSWLVSLVCCAALVGVAVAAGGALSQPAPTAPTGEELGHVRYEKATKLDRRWRASVGADVSSRAILFQKDLATPSSANKVDVVATVTIDYRLSGSDRGDLRFDMSPADGSKEGTLGPGPFRLSGTNGEVETRTFVWSKRGVAADGKKYTFQLETGVRDGHDHNDSAASSGRQVSVVIEMWPTS